MTTIEKNVHYQIIQEKTNLPLAYSASAEDVMKFGGGHWHSGLTPIGFFDCNEDCDCFYRDTLYEIKKLAKKLGLKDYFVERVTSITKTTKLNK